MVETEKKPKQPHIIIIIGQSVKEPFFFFFYYFVVYPKGFGHIAKLILNRFLMCVCLLLL